MERVNYATRAAIIALKTPKGGAMTTQAISELFRIPEHIVNRIYANAIRRGFEPNDRIITIDDYHVVDTNRSRRRVIEAPETRASTPSQVHFFGCPTERKTCANLTDDISDRKLQITLGSVKRALRRAELHKAKLMTRMHGLIAAMIQVRRL